MEMEMLGATLQGKKWGERVGRQVKSPDAAEGLQGMLGREAWTEADLGSLEENNSERSWEGPGKS